MENNEQIFIMNHPLIQHKLSFLRDKNTGTKEFRELVSEIATLMCYEATRDLPLMDVQTETPMCTATTKVIAGRKLAFVPILRAGLGMVDGMLQLVPSAKVGHIGLYRDHDRHRRRFRNGRNHHCKAQPPAQYQVPVHHCSAGGPQGTERSAPGRAYLLCSR